MRDPFAARSEKHLHRKLKRYRIRHPAFIIYQDQGMITCRKVLLSAGYKEKAFIGFSACKDRGIFIKFLNIKRSYMIHILTRKIGRNI